MHERQVYCEYSLIVYSTNKAELRVGRLLGARRPPPVVDVVVVEENIV